MDTEKLLKSLNENKVDFIVIGATAVNFPCLNDMIRMKKAAGRAKDIEDLKYLKKIKSQKK
jgi:predicted nucleotidyltransferase